MTQVITESAQTVEEQAQAVTPNIQSENQAGIEIPAGSGEVAQEATEVAPVAIEEAKAPSPTEEVNAIGDQNDYAAMKSRLQQDPNAFADPAPAEETTPAEAKAPVEEVTPAAPEAEEAVKTDAEGAVKEEEAEKRESQFRLRPEEKLDAEAFRIFKAAQSAQAPVSMSDAISLARNHLGIQEPQLAQPQQSAAEGEEVATGEEAEDDSVFEGITQESAKANLKELRQGQIKAMRDGDLDEAADIGEQIIDAEELVEVLGSRETEAAQTAEVERTSQFESSYTKAVETFPDFAKEDTPFFAKCKEIDQALETTDDPRYYEANKPLLVAQMAARELNIVPVVAGQAPVAAPVAVQDPAKSTPETSPQSTSPQPARTEKPAPLPAASGASRTGGSTGTPAQDLQQKIADITSPAQFAAMAKQLGQTG